jgi:hypothetical protein
MGFWSPVRVNPNAAYHHDNQGRKERYMQMMTRALVIGALLAMTAVSATGQGLVWESVTKGGPAGQGETPSTTVMMPGMMKHVTENGTTIIVRLDQEKMYSINPGEKSYWVMTFAEMEQMMKAATARMNAMKGQMEEQMKNMPPEQREMVEKMMGVTAGGSKEAVSIKATGKTKTLLGYKSTQYVARQGDKDMMTMFVTKGIGEFDGMRRDWEQFNKRLLSMGGGFAEGMAEAYTKIEGFPMEMEIMGATTTVTKLEKKSTPPSEFEVPAGYTQTKPPTLSAE